MTYERITGGEWDILGGTYRMERVAELCCPGVSCVLLI